ncbi:MAG TPA: DUF5615 family PIN-like protein [Verrucomicrobiae bacterium]|jgi:predicted nuclease of predicted toxin-antitoxin system
MKGYLFDGNVPSHLRFVPKFPIIPLSKVGRIPSDSRIWDFARMHDLVIVSKDADFSDRIITSSWSTSILIAWKASADTTVNHRYFV